MSLSESALKKLSTVEVILALKYHNKFDATLENIKIEIFAIRQSYEKIESEVFIFRQVS